MLLEAEIPERGDEPLPSIGIFLKSKAVWAIVVAHFCNNWSLYILITWLPTFVREGLGVPFESVGWLTMIPHVSSFVFINVAVGSLIRPKRNTEEGLEIYECGEPTTGDTWIKFDIRYYTVALVYVVFAVEIAFLFPWAIVLDDAFAGTGVAEGSGVDSANGCLRNGSGALHRDPLPGPRLRVGQGRPRLGPRLAGPLLRSR